MFSPTTREAIGSYVYALADADDHIFYIGKGEKDRVFSHVEEVRQMLVSYPDGIREFASDQNDDIDGLSQKQQIIADMLRAGKEPIKYIIREGLTSEQALLIEAVLISVLDRQLDGGLSNKIAGHGTARFGLKTAEELEATKGESFQLANLPGLLKTEEVVAINVNRRWGEVVAKQSTLFDISKGHWKLSKTRAERCRFAVIHANGIVRGVFKISRWIGPDAQGRLAFEAVDQAPMLGSEFSQKNAASLYGVAGSGSQNPIRYVRL